ncbi:MAG: tRNA (adenosine(37)-N6)-threonylcarbamoyltransferase complex ATPase subunit type 1 TsaE [Saprospiraceae bacterium]|nr:tRNA (adenosine(37)-N6)-threonylcarbamoyltransferase complex ATPase subunit type 1 TsaE [Saprospiraceae bacterium]
MKNISNLEQLQEKDLPVFCDQTLKGSVGIKKWMLQGDLGSGKTTLVKAFCKVLGVQEEVSSPSYSLVNEYEGVWEGETIRIFHIDLYRLESIEEALGIGIEEYLEGDSFCFIEWPDLIRPIWPHDSQEIKLLIEDESNRKILFL